MRFKWFARTAFNIDLPNVLQIQRQNVFCTKSHSRYELVQLCETLEWMRIRNRKHKKLWKETRKEKGKKRKREKKKKNE